MIGKTISHYRIIEKCGEGGMGIVYKAEDTELNRAVAIKFLPAEISANEEERKRFKIEAQAAAGLNHPNITIIYAIEEHDDELFIVMEYIEGQDLKKKISTGPLSVDEALNIAFQIADGLQAAHDKGIIHRDIKSANIMVSNNNQVKIMDFGIAKVKGYEKITKTGTTIGTLAYMSPQQAQGYDLDQHADIWSFGIVLYEMVTAQLPFVEDNEAALIYSIMSRAVPPPTEINHDIPIELENIILQCLYKDTDHRYSSFNHIIKDLRMFEKRLKDVKRKHLDFPESRPPIKKETERRQATVMFIEIAGYRALMESLDPEEAASTMNICFEMMDSIVTRYYGVINRIMENNIEVLFGVPKAIEEAPKEAVNAAISLYKILDQFNQEHDLPVRLDTRIGINTGTVIAGTIGTDKKQDYTVIGDTVTIASQLKDLSEKGQVLVGSQTYKHTLRDFKYEALKSVPLRDGAEPTEAYRLLSFQERLYRFPQGSERIIYSEMVGREKELDKLKLHVLKAINGEGSVLNIIGEAGIGKSRLITELSSSEELKRVVLLKGRALSIGSNLSFHPIIDIIRSWARIGEDDSPAIAAQKLEGVIRGISPEQVAETVPFIATLMGLKLTERHAERLEGIEGDALEKLILKTVRELLAKASSITPLVVILEDLHWADMSTFDLIESLFKLAEGSSILFINVMRPNYETSERIIRTIRNRYPVYSDDINLMPLNNTQCEILIKNLLNIGDFPVRIKELVTQRAEGNPFFIEEVARSFIDDGVVTIENDRFKVTEKIDSVIIPESINEVIMARVDKLEEQTRSLLKVASVIGRNFFYRILVKVARSVKDCDERLEHLKEIQLIKERKGMEELEYLFKHALARDAVYSSIPQKKQRQLHLDVARSIELIFSERLSEFYGVLAFHYSRADDMEKAEEYLLKAGEEALKAAASNEALNYFRDALELYMRKFGDAADPDKIAGLKKKIGLALHYKGHFSESVEHFDHALVLWGMKQPKSALAVKLKLVIDLLWMLKEINYPSKKKKRIPGKIENDIMETSYRKIISLISIDTNKMFIEGVGLFRRVGRYDLTKIEHGLAFLSGFSALFSYSGVSINIGSRILDYFKPYLKNCDDRTVFAYNYWKTVCDYVSGEWMAAQDFDEELIDRMVLKGEMYTATGFVAMQAFIQTELGDFNGAQKRCNKFLEIAEEFEDDYHKARLANYSIKLLLRSGKLRELLDETETMIPFVEKIGQTLGVIYLLGMRANAQILLHDITGAEASLQKAADLVSAEKRVSPLMLSTYLSSQSLLNLYKLEHETDYAIASDRKKSRMNALLYTKATFNNSRKFAAEQTKALRLMGVYYWVTGNQKKAVNWWEKSIRNGKNLNARPELSRTYMEIGMRLTEAGSSIEKINGSTAGEYLEMARGLFTELSLENDLKALNALSSP